MDIKIDDNTSIAAVIMTLAICIAAVLIMLNIRWHNVEIEAIKAGLEQVQNEGSFSVRWAKPQPIKE